MLVVMMMMKTPSTKRVKVIPIRAKLRHMFIKVVLMNKAKLMRVKNVNNRESHLKKGLINLDKI